MENESKSIYIGELPPFMNDTKCREHRIILLGDGRFYVQACHNKFYNMEALFQKLNIPILNEEQFKKIEDEADHGISKDT